MVALLKAQLEIISFISWASGPSTEILIPGAFRVPTASSDGYANVRVWFSLVGDHYSGQGKAVGTEAVKGGFQDTASFETVLLSESRSPSRETLASKAS